MNQLSTFLVESILNEEIQDLVVIYSGRFQPFHKGHFGVYQHLVKKFGKNNVYIATSDKTEPKRSPLKFKEKQEIMNKMFGISKSQIIKIKNPYAPTEILKKYDSDTTAYISVVGEKDASRLTGKYFKSFPKDGKFSIGYKDGGYVYIAPTMARGLSGTQVRAAFSTDHDVDQQKDVFRQLYPKFDQKIFDLLTKKLKEHTNPIYIPKQIIDKWIVERFPKIINEVTLNVGFETAGDLKKKRMSSFINDDDVYHTIHKDRAQKIGYELVKHIIDGNVKDFNELSVDLSTNDPSLSFMEDVIGRLTSTTIDDFQTKKEYHEWFETVMNSTAKAGYDLLNFRDEYMRTVDGDMSYNTKGFNTTEEPRIGAPKPTKESSENELYETAPIFISKEVIKKWSKERFSKLMNEISSGISPDGNTNADDGPIAFFPNFDIYDDINKDRAERIGYTVVKQIMNQKYEDYYDHPIYPDGPIDATSSFPAGVIGKLTAMNQRDFDSIKAYDDWFQHVTRKMALAGYELITFSLTGDFGTDEEDRELSTSGLNTLDDDPTSPSSRGISESKQYLISEEEIEKIADEAIEEFSIHMGYPTKQQYDKKIKDLEILQNKLDKLKQDDEEYTSIKQEKIAEHLKESYDKTLFYLQYFRDLAPESMIVKQSNGNIIIEMNNSLSEQTINVPKSLGITRENMPQIAAADIDEYVKWLKSRDIEVNEVKIPVKSIKMTQKEIDSEKVSNMMSDKIDSLRKIVIISNDNYLLDGHHRVVAIYNIDKTVTIKAFQVDLPIDELLKITSNYPKTFYKSIDEQVMKNVILAESSLKLRIPSDIRKIHKLFKKNRKKLYIVGGAVRDAILGKSPKDFDLATDAKPDEVIQIAKQGGFDIIEVGKSFGVVVVGGHEIATFRKDIGKGRRPDSVDYTDIEGDVRRRDLTINALFYDLDKESIVDLVGGIEDLQKKRVRTVGEPSDRFNEDPLRKLRAIRFAAQIGRGSLEGDTYNALRSNPSLKGVSVERIRDEFIKGIQKAKSISQYLILADDVGLLSQIFPKVKITKPFINEKVVEVLIAYLLQTNNKNKLQKYLNKLGYSVEEIRNIKFLLQLSEFDLDNIVSLKRLHDQVSLSDNDIIRFGKYINKDFRKFINFKLNINGKDLMDKGYKGKEIGTQMNKLEKQRYLNEDINIPVNIGDTILTGRFKNKKTVVKTISKDDHGMPTINGRKVVTFRIPKEDKSTNEQMAEVMLDEAPMKIKRGYKFTAKNSFQDVEKGAKYVVNAIKGTIGDLRILVTRLGSRGGKTDHKEINVRSIPEFYKYIMMENVINEAAFSYGCLFLDVPFIGWNKVTSTIDVEDIYESAEGGFGIEDKPHITILYGLHDDVIVDEIVDLTADIDKVDYIIQGVSVFENEHYDVVKFDIESDDLRQLNERVKSLPHTSLYSDYNPHMTIAYVKPGLGKKYKKAFNRPTLKTSNQFIYSTSSGTEYKWVAGETDDPHQVLSEGGAYGHMAHPFDQEIDLTFGDLKNIVNLAFEGELDTTVEKTDGQALAVSWRDGKLIAARNKGHLKNKGERALDIHGIRMKFDGRGELSKAYNYAMRDLQNAISKLTDKQKEFIFKGGSSFMNLEVIYPENANVIQYGQPLLIFHGTMEYDENGKAIGENKEAARILAGMIKQVNQNVQKTYAIQGPPVVSLPKRQNLSRLKGPFLRRINKLQSEFNLKDDHGVNEYHIAWWTQWIEKNAPMKISSSLMKGLVKRWALNDKSFRLNNKNIDNNDLLEWTKKVDKQDLSKIQKENLRKFEDIFLGIGAEILSFVSSALVVNPDSALQSMKSRLDKTIKDIEKGGSEQQIKKLRQNLERLEAIGGVDKIVPIEGIVFNYKGQTLKLTGSFASLNQILGIMYY